MVVAEETPNADADDADATVEPPATTASATKEAEKKDDDSSLAATVKTQDLKAGETPMEGSPPAAEDEDAEKKSPAPKSSARSRRVFIKNLPYDMTWQQLKEIMSSRTGHKVHYVDLILELDGRSKGCAIVEFASPEGARQAVVSLNNAEIENRQVFVREDREERTPHQTYSQVQAPRSSPRKSNVSSAGKKPKGQGRRLYVGNLNWDVAWQDLKDHMKQAGGEVLFSEILKDPDGRSKGCGIVEFATREQATTAAAQLGDSVLKGRVIFIREDRESSKGLAGAIAYKKGNQQLIHVPNRSVYVSNLVDNTTWQNLKDHMRKAGNVERATLLVDSVGQATGSGTVVFQKAAEAARAVRELDGSILNGSKIGVQLDRLHSMPAPSGKGAGTGAQLSREKVVQKPTEVIAVGNISYEVTWKDLKDLFSRHGKVERAIVRLDAGRQSKGSGVVRFATKEDAKVALEKLDGVNFRGRPLRLHFV